MPWAAVKWFKAFKILRLLQKIRNLQYLFFEPYLVFLNHRFYKGETK